jgi:hypothetical protein
VHQDDASTSTCRTVRLVGCKYGLFAVVGVVAFGSCEQKVKYRAEKGDPCSNIYCYVCQVTQQFLVVKPKHDVGTDKYQKNETHYGVKDNCNQSVFAFFGKHKCLLFLLDRYLLCQSATLQVRAR